MIVLLDTFCLHIKCMALKILQGHWSVSYTHLDVYKRQKEVCPKLSKPPYVCNGCKQRRICTLEKAFYNAHYSQDVYKRQPASSTPSTSIC